MEIFKWMSGESGILWNDPDIAVDWLNCIVSIRPAKRIGNIQALRSRVLIDSPSGYKQPFVL